MKHFSISLALMISTAAVTVFASTSSNSFAAEPLTPEQIGEIRHAAHIEAQRLEMQQESKGKVLHADITKHEFVTAISIEMHTDEFETGLTIYQRENGSCYSIDKKITDVSTYESGMGKIYAPSTSTAQKEIDCPSQDKVEG